MLIANLIPVIIKVTSSKIPFCYSGQAPTCYVCQEVGHAILPGAPKKLYSV